MTDLILHQTGHCDFGDGRGMVAYRLLFDGQSERAIIQRQNEIVVLLGQLSEELADSFMNDQTGPLIIDLEDALHPAAQGTDSANSAQPPAAQDDSLFPVETQSPETLAHAAEAAAHDAMAASPDQPTQAQAESTSPQPQSAEAQAAPAAASPSPDMMESETDQMAVLQHLTQNGH